MKLDPAKAKQIETEAQSLIEQAQAQLNEWKVSMKALAAEIRVKIGEGTFDAAYKDLPLLNANIDSVKLDLARISKAEGEDGERSASVMWDIPDYLYDFVKSPPSNLQIPPQFAEMFKGGLVVEAKEQRAQKPVPKVVV